MALVSAGLIWLLNYSLDRYTEHGISVQVPDLSGLALTEVETTLSEKKLSFAIIDSAEYDPSFPRGSVISQYPDAGSQVKTGRELKLTINPF